MLELIALVDAHTDLLFGSSAASARLLSQVERVAGTPRTTVLVRGPRGRELEWVARAIHARSKPALAGLEASTLAARGPFHGVDCAQLTRRETGAPGTSFAGPDGLFARIRGGTLFLSEVADLNLAAQGHLLQMLERRGADAPPLRVVASTAKELEVEVESDRFRSDLFYRLNVLTIRVPSLRERLDDLPDLAAAVLRRLRALLGTPVILSSEALERLTAHSWPGNIFELEVTLGHAALAADGKTIEAHHLNLDSVSTGSGARPEAGELIPAAPSGRSLRHVEEAAIRRVLIEEGGNRSRAARTLGINRTTLYNKLRQYGIA